MSFSIGAPSTGMGPGQALARALANQADKERIDGRVILRLLQFLLPHWRRMAVAGVLMLLSSGLSLAAPYLTKVAIDQNIAGGDTAGLLRTALLMTGSFVGLYFTTAAQQYLLSWVGQRILFTLRAKSLPALAGTLIGLSRYPHHWGDHFASDQ